MRFARHYTLEPEGLQPKGTGAVINAKHQISSEPSHLWPMLFGTTDGGEDVVKSFPGKVPDDPKDLAVHVFLLKVGKETGIDPADAKQGLEVLVKLNQTDKRFPLVANLYAAIIVEVPDGSRYGDTVKCLGLVTESMAGERMYILDRLNSTGKPENDYSEDKPRYYFQQIVTLLRWMRKQNYNIATVSLTRMLVTMQPLRVGNRDVSTAILRAFDMGFSVNLHFPNTSKADPKIMPNFCSKEFFIASQSTPENKLKDPNWEHQDAHVVWTLAVLLYFMVFRILPFEDPANRRFEKIKNNVFLGQFAFPKALLSSKRVSRPLMDLLTKCFDPDPKTRYTLDGIWHHQWFKTHLPLELQEDGCKELANPKERDGSMPRFPIDEEAGKFADTMIKDIMS